MNNKMVPVIIVILLLLVLGGGAVMMMGRRSTTPVSETTAPQPTQQTAVETPATAASQKLSLKSLMGLTTTQKCTFTDNQTGSSGTVYVSSGKMRGDFTSKTSDKTVTSHMISDGSKAYMWSDAMAGGFMMSLDAINTAGNGQGGTPGAAQAVDVNRQTDYSCGGWIADTSLFTVPTTVKFQDYSSMMKAVPTGESAKGTGAMMPNSSAACAACANLSGDQKAQCLTALNCK